MTGCRPLTPQEVQAVVAGFEGKTVMRDRALFLVALRTGLRISSVIALRIGDVWQDGQVLPRIRVRRATTKGKRSGFDMPLHPKAAEALQHHLEGLSSFRPEEPVFRARQASGQTLHRTQAWRIFKKAFARAGRQGVRGELGCHSTRKTFAGQMYQAFGYDLLRTARALRHSNISTTTRYLSFDEKEIDRAILNSF